MNTVPSICIVYDGVTLQTIAVESGDTLTSILGKINQKVGEILQSQSVQNLDLEGLAEIEATELTRNVLDQLFIEKIKDLLQCCEQNEAENETFASRVLGITVDIDLRELMGIYNTCVPGTPLTLRELLSLLVSEIATLKKKDYTQGTCDEDCGIVLTAGGAFVECLATSDAEGDFNALDFLDIDSYSTFENL